MNSALRSIVLLTFLFPGCSEARKQREQEEPRSVFAKARDRALDVASKDRLRQIGMAYQMASISGSVRRIEDLKENLDGGGRVLTSPRDQQPYEIVLGVNLSQVADAGGTLLAWEKDPDVEGGRCVLFANLQPGYLGKEEFERTPKAKGNR